MVGTTVSTVLRTGIIVRLVSTVVVVSVRGTVKTVDSLVMTVEVIGQVVILLILVVSVCFGLLIKDRIALLSALTL